MIAIIKKNFQKAQIEEYILDTLIASNKLIAFYRSNKWVVVGKDVVRQKNSIYQGEERRKVIYGSDFCMK